MPIAELLISSTAPMVVKFLLEQVEAYKGRKGKKTIEIEDLEKTLKPFKERLEVNETELEKIQENAQKLSEKLMENRWNVTDEMFKNWASNLLDEKLRGMKQDKSTFKIKLWTAKKAEGIKDISVLPRKYRIGEKIIVYFRSDRDCYVTLFNIGTSGELTVLFPNYLSQNNFIRANRTYAIPGNEYPFNYELSGPLGVEKIKAIATISRQNLLNFEFSKGKFFHSAKSGIATRDINIVAKKMEDAQVENWAETMCEFTVE